MTLKTTKDQLIQLLDDKDNKVIALSGKWGTGKSHLWREVKVASADSAVKNALYVSLFGLSDMNHVKLKVVQSALPNAEMNPAAWERIKTGMEGAKKFLTAFHKAFSALDELALLAVPTILKDKVIVLDDIERKHNKLSIDEVLGFIDEFTQQHGARFVLILNSDQLDNRALWEILREKVVDQELRLSTSPSEAFSIAIDLTPSAHMEQIRSSVEVCGVTNIRIIRKVIKAVNSILLDRHGLTDAVLSRVIPSTVLLSAIHYKGIEHGPDFDFVLSQGAPRDWSIRADEKDAENEVGQRKAKWNLMLTELGILGCDDYELLVVEYLQSGLFDVSKVAQIIDRYIAEADEMNARDGCKRFIERCLWDHRLSESELLSEAAEIANTAHLIDPYMVTSLYDCLMDLPNGEPIAKAAVDRWVEGFRAKNLEEAELNNFFGRKIHPQIEAEFHAIKAKAQANTSAYDACVYVAENSGWGARQEAALKSATVEEMEATIRNSPITDMRFFLLKMLDLCIHKNSYQSHFGSAMDNFVHACRNIIADQNSGRLGKLVRSLFANSTVAGLLDPSAQDRVPDGIVSPTATTVADERGV